ncbi:hypothetical protein Sjap_017617 [Stephania japonica]|uniref:Vacuolar iron transporter n=1 Tax=Stephania japonica TaxID=461633 RepID=A0AAP0I6I6_9MAGN
MKGDHKNIVYDHDKAHELAQRAQWLRAAILGANDGLLSTTALMIGVGAAREDRWSMILSGLAGAIAGACSMAVGEFVSVSTQRDIEKISLMTKNSHENIDQETKFEETKAQINNSTPTRLSLSSSLCVDNSTVISPARSPAMRVISEGTPRGGDIDRDLRVLPCPFRAALASAVAFLCGSFVPLLSGMAVKNNKMRIYVMVVVTTVALAGFGGVGAHLGGSRVKVSAVRVLLGGWISMGITYGLLKSFGHHDHD